MNNKWKKIFLASTLCITLYNTLPSAFYYSRQLDKPLSKQESKKMLSSWNETLAQHNKDIYEWLVSFTHALKLDHVSISAVTHSQRCLKIEFKNQKDSETFEKYFAKAIEHLPYKEYQLELCSKKNNSIFLTKKFPASSVGFNQFTYSDSLASQTNQDNLKKFAEDRLKNILQVLNRYDAIEALLSDFENQTDKTTLQKGDHLALLFQDISHNPQLSQRFIDFSLKNNSRWIIEFTKNSNQLSANTSDTLNSILTSIKSAQKNQSNFSHPLFKSFSIDLKQGLIRIQLHDDVAEAKQEGVLKALLQNTFCHLKIFFTEELLLNNSELTLQLIDKPQHPFIAADIAPLIDEFKQDVLSILEACFFPETLELNKTNYPLCLSDHFSQLSPIDQEACLVVHSTKDKSAVEFSKLNSASIYVIAKNLDKLIKDSDNSSSMQKDLKKLNTLLASLGFQQIPSNTLGSEFSQDIVFENKTPLKGLFELINEDLTSISSTLAIKSLPILRDYISESTTRDLKKQEALVTWDESYKSSINHLKGLSPFSVAKPTKSPLWNNLKLNVKHFLQGNEKRALKFGLDLSGGKNILIQLEDKNGRKISNPEDIKLGIDELYARVNKLGVSEVSIRQEGDYISLDFPGSQNLSAKDLVDASTMFFHVVNEEFSTYNPETGIYVEQFLKKVWQEAQSTRSTDQKSLQKIALKLLNDKSATFIAGSKLKEKGLLFADPEKDYSSSQLDSSLSKIVKIKISSEDKTAIAPLMIVFNNYALEGSALRDIQTSYDPSKGNFLNFSVARTTNNDVNPSSPQENLSNWTSYFTKNKNKLSYKPSHGWRMAVILNSEIVSAPVLESALKDSASITGSFSQRDLLKLKSDLQAGSLSFQPKVILEQNVAPELGAKDKHSGFVSMGISVVLVTLLMISYYRFHGIVAICALLINLAMLFAAANFFGITLSLASIAGIVLTLGMAVDANVLVFERMKEEFSKSLQLKDAVVKGYQKAFTAIIDSNLTTMIAAGVLLSFDSGPIKGFALTLLIGLVTSVMTALFMTKFFYFSWMEKTKTEILKFSNWFKFSNINFLKYAKIAAISTAAICVIGAASFNKKASDLIGMDFKGGYGFDIQLEKVSQEVSSKDVLAECFVKAGLKKAHVHVRQMDNQEHLRVFIDPAIEHIKAKNQPWSQFLEKATSLSSIKLTKECLSTIDDKVSSISGQLSETMKNQAILGLVIALGAIFVYVLIRFEWPYALAATLSLIHDVAITLSFTALLCFFNIDVHLDMSSLAAILTIIGYSLNDTIIVFDRIREEVKNDQASSFRSIVLKSLNTTLSRTILTSATTLIVLIPMIFIGHGTLFNFSLVMTIGVVFGTLSTLYVACPLLLYFYKRQPSKQIDI